MLNNVFHLSVDLNRTVKKVVGEVGEVSLYVRSYRDTQSQ